ncbi:MAG: extracellular solute-binding protein [Treponema sp.]|jgi:putative aldouronate transport system substrate-binding protein|nr:extracellular solute-binding protein [Treponema sp.]
MKKFPVFAFMLLAGVMQVLAGGRQSGAQQTAQDLGPRGSGKAYWYYKYPQTVTLHTVNFEYPYMDYHDGDNTANNPWTRVIKDYLNIQIATDWIAGTVGDYSTKLNLAIAAREIPDFFQCGSTQFVQLQEAGLIADITDYLENNVSDTIKKRMASAPDILDTVTRNGRIYAIPQGSYGPLTEPEILWLRKDWLEQAGVRAPGTIAELETLMQTFMKQHPGSYGIPLGGGLDEFAWLAVAWDAYPFFWYRAADGSVVNGSVQPEVKQVLEVFADWYKKGYLKQDWMSSNSDTTRVDLMNNEFGIQLFPQWWGFVNAADMVATNGKNSYMEAFDIPSATGKPVRHPRGFDNEGYIVFNKNSKNIAAALKCVSFYSEHGTEIGLSNEELSERFYHGESSHIMPMIKTLNSTGSMEGYLNLKRVRETGDTSFWDNLTYAEAPGKEEYEKELRPYLEEGNTALGIGRFLQIYSENCAFDVSYKIDSEKRWVYTAVTGPVPEEVASYGSTLDDILREGFAQIIVGQRPISYFDTLVAMWKSSGGDHCTQVMNRVYGKK